MELKKSKILLLTLTSIGLTLNIFSTAYPQWSRKINFNKVEAETQPELDIGLWLICSKYTYLNAASSRNGYARAGNSKQCSEIGILDIPKEQQPSYYAGIRALMIITTIINFISCLSCVAWNLPKKPEKLKANFRTGIVTAVGNLTSACMTMTAATWYSLEAFNNFAVKSFNSDITTFAGTRTIGACVIVAWCKRQVLQVF